MADHKRVRAALDIADSYGSIDGDHHKMWVIDQMVRALTGCPLEPKIGKDVNGKRYRFDKYGESAEYRKWLAAHKDGEDGPETYGWDEGIAP